MSSSPSSSASMKVSKATTVMLYKICKAHACSTERTTLTCTMQSTCWATVSKGQRCNSWKCLWLRRGIPFTKEVPALKLQPSTAQHQARNASPLRFRRLRPSGQVPNKSTAQVYQTTFSISRTGHDTCPACHLCCLHVKIAHDKIW